MPDMALMAPVLWALAILIGYLLLRCRMIAATQRMRIAAVVDADRLASNPDLPQGHRDALHAIVENTLNPAEPWRILLRSVIVMIRVRTMKDHFADLSNEHRREVESVVQRAFLCLMAQSPIASVLLVLSIILFVLFSGTVHSVKRRLLFVVETAPASGAA